MANITVVASNAGLTEITANLANVSLLDITKFEIGNGFNYTPTASQIALNGTKIFDQNNSGGSISKILVGTKSVELQIILNSSVTLSNIGEFLFKTSSDVIVAIGAFDAKINKVSGSTLTLKILINITNNGAVTITNANTVFNSINVVEVSGSLPIVSNPSSNVQIVRNYDGNGAVAIAFKDSTDAAWKYFTQVQGSTVLEDEIVLSKSNRTLKTSSKKISDDTDFTTDSHNKIPTKYAVEQRIQAIVAAAPGALDTLNELAAALGNDANFATTMTNALAGKLSIASNLSDLNNKKTARANLGVETKTTFSNADITLTVNDRFVLQTGTMTAPRTATLPAASEFNSGQPLIISDVSGTVNSVNKIAITAAGSDTIDSYTSINLNKSRGVVELISDGVSKWKTVIMGNPYLSELFSNKNAIINGDFKIWQRGISFPSVVDSTYAADRFIYGKLNTTAVHDISRSTDVPTFAQAGRLFNYSMLVDCQTADTSVGSTEVVSFGQVIEGYNFLPLAQKAMNLSFWVKATKIGTYCVNLRNGGEDRSYVAEFTINASNTWEYKTITIAASPSAGTWNYTNGSGLILSFVLMAGSNYQTTANAWQTGNFIATENQVNACDSTSNNFQLCGIQLESGSVATPFENRTIQEELALCQRYFEKSYNLETPIGTIINGGGCSVYTNQNAQPNKHTTFYKVAKRTAPSVATYSPNSGTVAKLFNGTTDLNSSVNSGGESSFTVGPAVAAGLVDLTYHWTAFAEL